MGPYSFSFIEVVKYGVIVLSMYLFTVLTIGMFGFNLYLPHV